MCRDGEKWFVSIQTEREVEKPVHPSSSLGALNRLHYNLVFEYQEIRHGRHCAFNLHVHLVFVAKYRRLVFDQAGLDTLKGIFRGICAKFEATLVEMDGERDHVHLLVQYPPKLAVSALVNSLKGLRCGQDQMVRFRNCPARKIEPASHPETSTGPCSQKTILRQRTGTR